MSDTEEIVQLAQFLYGFDPDSQPWDGDAYGYDESLRRNGKRSNARRSLRQARALIAEGAVSAPALRALPGMWDVLRSDYAKKD